MAIRVTCPKCLTRFNVSEKFAGLEGPCPKCKNSIKVPALSEEVKVHGPASGPTDSTGRAISKPIFRKEQPITPVHWTLAGGLAGLMMLAAVMARFMYPDGTPLLANGVGALLAAFPVTFLGYALLRDREAGGYAGSELAIRVAICAGCYALFWLFSPIMIYAFAESWDSPGTVSQGIAVAGLLFAGGAVAMLCFDLEYLLGLVHAGFYLVVCIVMRMLAGLQAIPGLGSFSLTPSTPVEEGMPNFGWLLCETLLNWLGC